MKKILTVLAVLITGAGVYVVAFMGDGRTSAPADAVWRTAAADRGAIVAAVVATGTINPTTTVIVGSQLSGQVVEVLADYNDQVRRGQVVARLNSEQIRARLDAARADLAQAEASKRVQEAQIARVRADIQRAEAGLADVRAQVARADALLTDAERIAARQRDLASRGVAAQQAVDTAATTAIAQARVRDSARAQVASADAQIAGLAADLEVAQANIVATEAQIMQRAAVVRQIEVDLANTEIRSPVDGVIVQRNVELGQTVAASLQAPTLFLIAQDLRTMDIYANVDEADVGRVQAGQTVMFMVNAFPNRQFEGRVRQVRLGSQTVQNVVIYTTVIEVANPRQELMPGMTANLRVLTERRENVVRVPNTALRWRPPSATPAAAPAGPPPGLGGPPGGPPAAGGGGAGAGARALDDFLADVASTVRPTADQQRAIDAAVAEARQAFRTAFSPDQDPQTRRERMRAIREELSVRIADALDAERRGRFEALERRLAEARAGRPGGPAGTPGRVHVVGADGKPEPVEVRTGATDGTFTEILSGLEAGRAVIVGGGPRTAAAPGGPGIRFGF